jgi:hypothetical protein
MATPPILLDDENRGGGFVEAEALVEAAVREAERVARGQHCQIVICVKSGESARASVNGLAAALGCLARCSACLQVCGVCACVRACVCVCVCAGVRMRAAAEDSHDLTRTTSTRCEQCACTQHA